MRRVNWTSSDARTLVQDYLNERYRDVVSSVGLAQTRYGLVLLSVTAGDNQVSSNGVAKLQSVFDTTVRKRPLAEWTVKQMRDRDAAAEVVGPPEAYAVLEHENDTITLLLWPKPTENQTLSADALLAGVDMVNDADEPSFPTDFHNVLIYGATADAFLKMEKPVLARDAEAKYQTRLADLRYFLAKSAYLSRAPQDAFGQLPGRRVWPYGNLAT